MTYRIKMIRTLTNQKTGDIIVSTFSRTISAGNTIDAEHVAEGVMGPAWQIQICEEVTNDVCGTSEEG
jgi:hypothetical protein